tara:strand:+ start:17725 stop:18267 length:543 start_codon:yes stop_codon:yes gene_type:complete
MEQPHINILIGRKVKPGHESRFEKLIHDWIPVALRFPGHHGVVMLRPGPGSSEYGTLLRFKSEDDWIQYQNWPPYKAFLESLRPMLIDDPKVDRLHGMEAWFTHSTTHRSPPRWKMALLTWIGVCAMVWLMSTLVMLTIPDWNHWVRFFLVNTLVVAALTWMVMPLMTRYTKRWLIGSTL